MNQSWPVQERDLALGIDVGNAKIKLCAVNAQGRHLRWVSRPLPYDHHLRYRRHRDFERGIPAALSEFLGDDGTHVREAVVVLSSGYAYPTYREGSLHALRTVDDALPHARCAALSGTGEAVDAALVAEDDPRVVGPIAFSNGMGAVHLARRCEPLASDGTGLVLDTGGSTTAACRIIDGHVDPPAVADPANHLDHRLRHGGLTWIGLQTTPLEALAKQVPVGGRSYPVIPRGVTFDCVASLLSLVPSSRARRLSLFGLSPDKEEALRGIADAVNLDLEMATAEELLALARHFHQLAIERLALGLRRAISVMPAGSCHLAIAFGLGAASLAAPALRLAGVPDEGVRLGTDWLAEDLAEAASCYGACHLALERLTDRRWDVNELER